MKTINVFINGTDEHAVSRHGINSLANVLHAMVKESDDVEKICLDGSIIQTL